MNINHKHTAEGVVEYVTVVVRDLDTDDIKPVNVLLLPMADEDDVSEYIEQTKGMSKEALREYRTLQETLLRQSVENALKDMSDEFKSLVLTAVTFAQSVNEVPVALARLGYQMVIEDDDACIATDLVPDDLSTLDES
jgi:hypothetical protein